MAATRCCSFCLAVPFSSPAAAAVLALLVLRPMRHIHMAKVHPLREQPAAA